MLKKTPAGQPKSPCTNPASTDPESVSVNKTLSDTCDLIQSSSSNGGAIGKICKNGISSYGIMAECSTCNRKGLGNKIHEILAGYMPITPTALSIDKTGLTELTPHSYKHEDPRKHRNSPSDHPGRSQEAPSGQRADKSGS